MIDLLTLSVVVAAHIDYTGCPLTGPTCNHTAEIWMDEVNPDQFLAVFVPT